MPEHAVSVEVLCRSADADLAPVVRSWVPEAERLSALREELVWWVEVAAGSREWAEDYARHQPIEGLGPEAYRDRWLRVSDDLLVLAGPRFRARDPNRPFVGVVGASRPLTDADLAPLREAGWESFEAFGPGYVNLWSGKPAGVWAGTTTDTRLLAGRLGRLRSRPIPSELSVRPAADLSFYERYAAIHRAHCRAEREHALHARVETREDLEALASAGRLFHVLISGRWAGLVAGEAGVSHGLRGLIVVEALLDLDFRGHGYGASLSTLLARAVPEPDDWFLLGTIHLGNRPAYRSALGAGRIDVGGAVNVAF